VAEQRWIGVHVLVDVNWLRIVGKKSVAEDVGLVLGVVDKGFGVRVFEGWEGLDLLSIAGFC